jgi:hypothetical protein
MDERYVLVVSDDFAFGQRREKELEVNSETEAITKAQLYLGKGHNVYCVEKRVTLWKNPNVRDSSF